VTWWYVTPNMRYSSHLMMLILFEHSPQRGLGNDIYLLILFSTLLAGYVSSLLFQIVLLLTKWRASFISIYDYLYIMSHVNLWSKFCACSTKFLAPPLFVNIHKNPKPTINNIVVIIILSLNHHHKKQHLISSSKSIKNTAYIKSFKKPCLIQHLTSPPFLLPHHQNA